jgi:predicted DNA-binding protein
MSVSDTPSGRANVKTLAIRLEPELHAQLSIIAQLRASTITDEIRSAIEAHIEQASSNPDLTAQADAALEEIEREASTRREAIDALLGRSGKSAASRARSTRKATKEEPTSDS